MWSKRNFKLSALLYLMILANLSKGEGFTETATDNVGSSKSLADLNIEDQIKLSGVDATKSAAEEKATNGEDSNTGGESEATTESATDATASEHPTEPQSAITSEIINNVESVTEAISATESVSEAGTESAPVSESTTEAEAASESESATESESTTAQIDCVCNCTANGSQVKLECSTQAPDEAQTESSHNAENDISSNTDSTNFEPVTTHPTISEDTSTKSNDNSESITESETAEKTTNPPDTNGNPETITESTTETEATTLPPPCSIPGVQPHESVCQHYYDCSLEGSLDGSLHLFPKSCPDKQAFNNELNRCSRDISSCSNPIECLAKGGVADATSNSSYYLCEPRLIGGGFHIFHVDCSANEIFYPELGKCFIDFNNLPTKLYPPYNWNQIEDIDIVKAELKLLKEQDKLKLKQEKEKLKAEEKLQKQKDKENKKRAKEEEKSKKEKAKEESANFVCSAEGNFESSVGENTYYACVSKKGKLKALIMQCPIGSKFNAQSGTCVNSPPNNNNNGNDTDDDDEDDD